MKQLDFLHVETNSPKLKVNQKKLCGHGQKWVWPVWSYNSKNDYLKKEQMDELIFSVLVQIQES